MMLAVYIAVSAYIFWKAVYMTFHKRWIAGPLLILFGIVFWDWMPMEIMFGYYCYNKAGVTMHKTFAEIEDKYSNKMGGVPSTGVKDREYTNSNGIEYSLIPLGDSFLLQIAKKKHLFSIIERCGVIVDSKTYEPLSTSVNFTTDIKSFGSGGHRSLEVWMYKGGSCTSRGNLVNISIRVRDKLLAESRNSWNFFQSLTGGDAK
jgi:hypothetical protein